MTGYRLLLLALIVIPIAMAVLGNVLVAKISRWWR